MPVLSRPAHARVDIYAEVLDTRDNTDFPVRNSVKYLRPVAHLSFHSILVPGSAYWDVPMNINSFRILALCVRTDHITVLLRQDDNPFVGPVGNNALGAPTSVPLVNAWLGRLHSRDSAAARIGIIVVVAISCACFASRAAPALLR